MFSLADYNSKYNFWLISSAWSFDYFSSFWVASVKSYYIALKLSKSKSILLFYSLIQA